MKHLKLSALILTAVLSLSSIQQVHADTSSESNYQPFTNFFGYDGKVDISYYSTVSSYSVQDAKGYYEVEDNNRIYFDNRSFSYTRNPELTTSYIDLSYGSTALITTTQPVYLSSYHSSNPSVATVSETGLVTGVGTGYTTITATFATSYCTTVKRTCRVYVDYDYNTDPYFAALKEGYDASGNYTGTTLARTSEITTSYLSPAFTLYVPDVPSVIFASSNPSVATIDNNGLVTPISPGTCTIYASVPDGANSTALISCDITLTNPQLSAASVTINQEQSSSSQIAISGITEDSSMFCLSADSNIASAYYAYNNGNPSLIIYGHNAGTTSITVIIDKVPFTIPVTIVNIQINKATETLYPGKTTQLAVTGTQSLVTWTSKNTKIATVDANGKVTAKKAGNVVIQASVDGNTLYSFISVCPKQSYQALQTALNAIGTPYSQAKRMQKGYYDCSSLVWRCYHAHGVNIGASTYAPTAAEQARAMVAKKKVISYKAIESGEFKLLPGDLIFYSKPTLKNGRYKNIYHVAMFAGYTYNGSSPSGNLSDCKKNLTANICDADGTQVSLRSHEATHGLGKNIVVVARPLK